MEHPRLRHRGRVRRLAAAVLLAAWTIGIPARAATAPDRESARDDIIISVPFVVGPGGWKVGRHQLIPGVLELVEFIPEADDIASWSQMFTIQNFTIAWGGPTPQLSLEQLKEIREQACPGVTRWSTLAADANSILYEWSLTAPCRGEPIQHEIAKIIFGRFNRFLIRFTLKADSIPAALRQQWLERLSGARVETRSIP